MRPVFEAQGVSDGVHHHLALQPPDVGQLGPPLLIVVLGITHDIHDINDIHDNIDNT